MMKNSKVIAFGLVSLALVFSQISVAAQGTVQFFNSTLSKIKYQEVPGGPVVDMPVGAVVGLFWGRSPNNLHLELQTWPVAIPGLFGNSAATGVYPLNATNPGEVVWLKIAAWYNKGGATPFHADRSSSRITHYGESGVVQTTLLGPTAGPGTVIFQGESGTHPNRAKPFVIIVPEPSTWALLALGLSAVLLRCRRQNQ